MKLTQYADIKETENCNIDFVTLGLLLYDESIAALPINPTNPYDI